jgi:hypothetical protein
VTFGSHTGLTSMETVRWTDARITVEVPNVVPGPTSVTVTVEGRQSRVADFEVIE